MSKLKIALLQIAPENSLDKQLTNGIIACKKAHQQGADIALFPEMWSDGYEIPQDKMALEHLAITTDSDFIKEFGRLAKELEMAIAITFLENNEGKIQNSVIIFDRHGKNILHYAKVHTCDFGDERMLTRGNDFYVADLDTKIGTIKVGSMICFDREFPESGRILMLKGAELVLVPNACPMEINRLSQLRGRAFENMFAIATANYPQDKPD
ncbi:MAG: carbon-nitrogen hydrolase family protein [Lactobacillus sp.]|jgi:predicted amidohydrolase|nr:carbon-nitrogen hydrolase family protein [Lactobacillus sp.]MCH3906086.1 carbon-nitrogen hydrolase family protein [Lactobacillus sp.]MCH3990340.1 carbon-nitrogen hydrolase family protein [Lactobacillus sp.]MCH4068945.1 carbon-nitrogen hydrolase family protein [Lactobacillus sp.]MCI1303347.1 carbon-nitrogen hydrolase family protein [Lactobacillus sp.]